MSIELKTRHLVYIVLALFLAFFLLGNVMGHRRADRSKQIEISQLNKEILRYSTELEKKTVYVSQIEQELKTLKQAKEDNDVTNADLRKLNIKTLNELTKTQLTLKLVRDSVKHNGKIIVIHDTITKSTNCIELPFSFADSSQYVNLWGGFDTEGTMNYGISVPINVDLYAGIDKKTKKNTAIITTDNPYVTVNSISSIKLDIPKVKKWGIGIIGGYGVNLSGTIKSQPFIGVGVSYNIIRF